MITSNSKCSVVPRCHPDRKHVARGLCGSCYQVQWRNKTPERKRQHRQIAQRNYDNNKQKYNRVRTRTAYQSRYGITAAEYDALLIQQNNVCAICIKPDAEGKALAVDHDHATKIVRGLLCSKCNKGLGLFEDAPILLEKAAAYLARINQNGRLPE